MRRDAGHEACRITPYGLATSGLFNPFSAVIKNIDMALHTPFVNLIRAGRPSHTSASLPKSRLPVVAIKYSFSNR